MRRGLVQYAALVRNPQSELQQALTDAGLPDLVAVNAADHRFDDLVDEQWHRHRAEAAVPNRKVPVFRLVQRTWALVCGADPLGNTAEFDAIFNDWTAVWAVRSPGAGGSNWERRLPRFHMQRSNECLAAGAARTVLMAPDNAEYWLHYGSVLNRLGFVEPAIGAFSRFVGILPDDPRGHIALSRALNPAGRINEAIAEAERAIELYPDNLQYQMHWGNALRDAGQIEEAEEVIRQAIARNPDSANAVFSLSVLLARSERLAESLEAAQRALEFSPDEARLIQHADRLKRRLSQSSPQKITSV